MKIVICKLTPVNSGEELLCEVRISEGENEENESFPVATELYLALGLSRNIRQGGEELTREDYDALIYAANRTKALMKGIELLSYAPNTKKGLLKKLIMRKIPREFAEYACERLEALGYIDEKTQAEFLFTELAEKKLYGIMRIKQELYAKGFCRVVIEAAAETDIDFDAVCAERIEKHIGIEAFTQKETRNKAMASLGRYGFTFENIRAALELLKESL